MTIPEYSQLYKHWTYTARPELLPVDERVKLAYDRAKEVTLAWSEFSHILAAFHADQNQTSVSKT